MVIVLVMINLLNLSRKWSVIIKKWHKVEEILPQYDNNKDRSALAQRIKRIVLVAFMTALGII